MAGRNNATDIIYQDFTLPYAVSLTQVDFYYHVSTEDVNGQDYLTVILECPAGHNVGGWNLPARHDQAWTQASVVSHWLYAAGVVCRVKARGTTDDALPGTFYLDDFLVHVTEADEPPTPSYTYTPTPTRTATALASTPTRTRTPTTTSPGWQPKRVFLPLVVRGY